MAQRQLLHDILKGILGADHVYFQPPANLTMQYPCIVYKRDNASAEFAGDKPYHVTKRYMVTFISQDPDSNVWDKIAALPLCLHNRWYAVGNLNHDVFNLYFEGEIT
jgi:hypothetical protein